MTAIEPGELSRAPLYTEAPAGRETALHASRCESCARVAFPQRVVCPACGAAAAVVELRGPATVRTRTSVLVQPPGALIQAPYDVAVAEFDAGLCVIGLVDGPAEPGDRVSVVVVAPFPEGRTFAFRRTINQQPWTGCGK
jgi:uncharacterized OB-fold protein